MVLNLQKRTVPVDGAIKVRLRILKKLIQRTAILLFILMCAPRADATELLIPVGKVIALELENDCVTVAAFDGDGCGDLRIGDEIQAIDGQEIDSAADVRWESAELDRGDGPPAYELEFSAGGMEYSCDVHAKTGAILDYEAERDD